MTVRQMDFQLVTVGPSHSERLRSIWLDMLADSPGVYHERLDEALSMHPEEWRERAGRLSTRSATAIAAERDGAFIGFASGYLDRDGTEVEGQLSFFHVAASAGEARAEIASALLDALASWLAERGVTRLFAGVREDRVATLGRLLGLGFVPTGTRRPSDLDPDYDEVELVCLISGLPSGHVLLPARTAGRVPEPGQYRYRVI